MKNYLKILIFCFVLITLTSVNAQLDCSSYYPLKKGVSYEIASYNKKDKLMSTTKYLIKDIDKSKATIAAAMFDKRGREIMSTEYEIECFGNGVSIDFKSLMNAEVFRQYEGMKIDMTGTNLELPNNLKSGQKLPDANMHANIDSGIIKMKVDISFTDRTVGEKEKIKTPSGTYDCRLIKHITELKVGLKRKGTTKQWIAKDVGLVRSEEYNQSGKLISYSVLTKMN